MMNLTINILSPVYAIYQTNPDQSIPEWFLAAKGFKNLCYTAEELSIVCEQHYVPTTGTIDRDRICLQVVEIHELELTGVTAAVVGPLAQAGVNVFCMATYNTDYVLVPIKKLEIAKQALVGANFLVQSV